MAKGAAPIEKNVIVIDQQGNVYEPTWPKRAKGLVKSGRAHWVEGKERTICLVCPPESYLEEQTMSEHIIENNEINQTNQPTERTTAADLPTPREIFDQIVALQKAMTENSFNSMHRLPEALNSIFDGQEYEDGESVQDMVDNVTTVFMQREGNLQILLGMYQKMYEDALKRIG